MAKNTGKLGKKSDKTSAKHLATLSKKEHRLMVEESADENLISVYSDLKDLELADLTDFWDRSDGGEF